MLLLSHIKGLILVLKSSTEYNTELRFCSIIKRYVLMVSALAFTFKINRPFAFSAIKKVCFPQSRKLSSIKELFHSQGNFPWWKNFSTVKEIFLKQGCFLLKKLLGQGNFLQTRKISTKKLSANKDQKGSLKPIHSILNHMQRYFNPLMLVVNKRSYLLKWTIIVIFYSVLTESASMQTN